MIDRVKRHDASKRYRMAIEFGEPVTADAFELALERLQGETLEQRTPNRVSHRRADRVRERTVYDIEGSRESQTEATVEVHGEGGLYVKELVSGDEGRTEPSLAGLVEAPAVVTALDVLAVEGETEPFATPAFLVDADGQR